MQQRKSTSFAVSIAETTMTDKKQIIKRNAGTLVNSRNAKLMRDFIRDHSPYYNPDILLDKLAKKIAENGNDELSDDLMKDYSKAVMAMGLYTHLPVAEIVREEYRTFLIEMVKSIETEYDCKTPSEKALAEAIASSYVRVIQYSKELTKCTKEKDFSHEKNGYYSLVSKEVDRANRHFTTALLTLKQLKSPTMEVNVKAKNAFIGQNQQFNASNTQNENNERQ